jgi:hypothetical protein
MNVISIEKTSRLRIVENGLVNWYKLAQNNVDKFV